VDVPFAFTVPFSVAELAATLVDEPVVTVGGKTQFSLLPPLVEYCATMVFPDASWE
jgi:hypothetical protein